MRITPWHRWVRRREDLRDATAQRVPANHGSAQTQRLDELVQVLGVLLGRVGAVRLVAIAVAALVRREDVEAVGQDSSRSTRTSGRSRRSHAGG